MMTTLNLAALDERQLKATVVVAEDLNARQGHLLLRQGRPARVETLEGYYLGGRIGNLVKVSEITLTEEPAAPEPPRRRASWTRRFFASLLA